MSKATVVCLTPVKNEEWILERFLQAASIWADVIIVADQNSSDRSREIVKSFNKARLINNTNPDFNEPERQKLLIDESRRIPGKKLLIALDADEFLSGGAWETEEWQSMLEQKEGTIFRFKWPFITNDFKHFWNGDKCTQPFACIDSDDLHHIGSEIHSCRIPTLNCTQEIDIDSFSVMHFQFTDWKRMESKHRWYQCYERINFPEKSPVEIFRRYSHMYSVSQSDLKKIPNEWFSAYSLEGVDPTATKFLPDYYWDKEVQRMVEEYGSEKFKYIDLPGNNNLLLKYLRLTKGWKYTILERVLVKLKRVLQ